MRLPIGVEFARSSWAAPIQVIGSATIRPASGPARPMSKICFRSACEPSMPITAPIVGVPTSLPRPSARKPERQSFINGLKTFGRILWRLFT